MSHHCRCRQCGTRRAIRRPINQYTKPPTCRSCKGPLRSDHWMNNRNTKAMTCSCSGHGQGYSYPHRKGSIWCNYQPNGDWKTLEQFQLEAGTCEPDPGDSMSLTPDQAIAIHNTSFNEMVTKLAKPGADIVESLTPNGAHLLHMAVGISGEAGELLDAVKKHIIYCKPVDRENLVEELGDLEFYMEGVRQAAGISREETLNANKVKLLTGEKARYKLGMYTDTQAQDRADKVTV